MDQLARGLTAAGHSVVLYTTGDATCPVERRWLYDEARGFGGVMGIEEMRHIGHGYDALDDCDVIHDHTTLGPFVARTHLPVVVTNHGPFTADVRDLYRRRAACGPGVHVVAISHSQRRAAGDVAIAGVIHHGVDPDAFPVGRGDGGYVAFLGRMAPEKGAHRAIAAARLAGVPIRLAAKMWEAREYAYFRERVEPLLGVDAEYVGEVDGNARAALLGGAIALVHPIRWREPFGMVAVEALACGTPVVAFPEGAVPEIVDDGVTGFLCGDVADLARGILAAPSLDRGACRQVVETRFSTARMVRDHEWLYASVIEDAVGVRPLRAVASPGCA